MTEEALVSGDGDLGSLDLMAGGLATRMRPRTLTMAKAMLEVAGRPFVDWQLEMLAKAGYDDVVFCIAFLGEQIRDHVGDGQRYGVRVRYSDEGPTLLGTANRSMEFGAIVGKSGNSIV